MKNFWEGKHIVAYVALKHHTRFIVPIMEKLKSLGAKTDYLVAQAERSQEITAIETGLDYKHIFDYLTDEDKQIINEIYLQLRDTFGKTLIKDIAFCLQVPTVLDKTLSTTAQEYTAFKKYFETNRPDICLALHEVNRWGKMFGFHAKRNSIPFITLQEGLLTTASANLSYQMTGHVQYSSLCFVWGNSSKEKLVNYEAPKEKIIPVGNTHLTNEIMLLEKHNIRKKKRMEYEIQEKQVILLLFSATPPKSAELLPLFNTVVKNNQNIHLITKFHPATTQISINNWLNELPENLKEIINPVHGEENTYNLIAMSDVCVLSEGSTTGLEALCIGKPLVILELDSPVIYETNLVEDNIAIGMTPTRLGQALQEKTNFQRLMNQDKVRRYINEEICKPEGSIEHTVHLMENSVRANQASDLQPLTSEIGVKDKDWSFILPVTDEPTIFLSILESISIYAETHQFEVILLHKEKVSDEIDAIIKSLEGDISFLPLQDDRYFIKTMNQAAMKARGEYLLFLNSHLSPKEPGWLDQLKEQINIHGPNKLYGAHIVNKYSNIVHAGIILNENNQPMSAYQHLDANFPHAKKTRYFQMLDHFICAERDFFLLAGGFHPRSGHYKFMDLCLRVSKDNKYPSALFCGEVELIKLATENRIEDDYANVYFYSRWHGQLWENETQLLETDGVSTLQIDAARMTRALETSGLT